MAQANGLTKGRRMRVDTTVVETNIHYPTDSSLLGRRRAGCSFAHEEDHSDRGRGRNQTARPEPQREAEGARHRARGALQGQAGPGETQARHTPASAFSHFARHYDAHMAAAAARGYNPLLASYGPALLDRAVLDALCRVQGVSFYQAMTANLPGIGAARPEFNGLDIEHFLAGLHPRPASRHATPSACSTPSPPVTSRIA